MIEAFDKGDTWENAIRYAKELATQYETETFEFAKLSAIHQQIARMFDRIVSNERKLPQYFKVGYYGASFPLGYRNVTYVYRGNKQDHIKMFCDRIQNQFPKVRMVLCHVMSRALPMPCAHGCTRAATVRTSISY